LARDIAEVTQPLLEGLQWGIGSHGRDAGHEPTNPVALPRRLGLGGERRHEDGQGEGDEECHGARGMVVSYVHEYVEAFYAPHAGEGNQILQNNRFKSV
jgi:hypothetical protein